MLLVEPHWASTSVGGGASGLWCGNVLRKQCRSKARSHAHKIRGRQNGPSFSTSSWLLQLNNKHKLVPPHAFHAFHASLPLLAASFRCFVILPEAWLRQDLNWETMLRNSSDSEASALTTSSWRMYRGQATAEHGTHGTARTMSCVCV